MDEMWRGLDYLVAASSVLHPKPTQSLGKRIARVKEELFKKLPEELVFDILFRLPVKSLGRLKCADKSWHSFINNPHFVRAFSVHVSSNYHRGFCLIPRRDFNDHDCSLLVVEEDNSNVFDGKTLQTKEFAFPIEDIGPYDVMISGYCDGLLCLVISKQSAIVIWNPSINEYKIVPYGSCSSWVLINVLGIGYDSLNEDYKIVRIYGNIFLGTKVVDVQVFTLKTNSWRTLENSNFPCVALGYLGTSCTVNGNPHWVLLHQVSKAYDNNMILYFDAHQESFGNLLFPFSLAHKKVSMGFYLGHVKGCLSLSVYHEQNQFELWVMKEYGMTESWSNLLTIPHNSFPQIGRQLWSVKLVYFRKDGDFVLKLDDSFCFIYNQKHGTFGKCKLPKLKYSFRDVPYVESLVSPNDGSTVSL